MICRMLKNLTWVVLVVSVITACTPVDQPNSPARTASGKMPNNKLRLSQASASVRLFGHQSISQQNGNPATDNSSDLSNNDFWGHLRSNFHLPPVADRPEVQAQINWYVHHQQYLNRVITRAAPYMYYILDQVEQRNLPAELVLLPIMESAYNPFANSNRGAAGLWQLIHTTAYGFGVKQDWWYDGRRDIYASTNAALDYLTYLQSYFGGNWLLAIAAYDAGEGGVQAAVRRNERQDRNTDFWSLQLPAETRSYVPRLLALASIINNPGRYSIALPPINDQPYLQQVDIGAPINLSQAAKLAQMSLCDLKQLNPGYCHMMTGPNGPYKLLLPIDRIPVFKQNLAASPALTKTVWASYKVQHGDSLAGIAKRYHTTVAELRDSNQLKNHAPVGKVIMIPTGTESIKPHLVDEEPSSVPSPQQANTENFASNQNSTQMANNNQPAINPNQLVNTQNNNANASNNRVLLAENTIQQPQKMADTSPPVVSDVSTVSNDSSDDNSSAPTAVPSKRFHTVKNGETLYSIAKLYKVKVNDLQKWNKLKAGKGIKPGSKLTILSSSVSSMPAASNNQVSGKKSKVAKTTKKSPAGATAVQKPVHHVVQSGDNLHKIAKKHGVKVNDLKAKNHLKSNTLKPGQKLAVK